MRTLWLKKNEDRRLRAGHLWVFSNEVDTQKSPLTDFAAGEEATLCDFRGAPLASVCVTPASLICARIHSRKPHVPLDASLIQERLAAALALREKLFERPYYRLCHGEGDFLPGLVIDRYGTHCTVQITTAAMECRRESIMACLDALISPHSILYDNDLAARALEGLPRVNDSRGPVPELLDVPENGASFLAPCATGQKRAGSLTSAPIDASWPAGVRRPAYWMCSPMWAASEPRLRRPVRVR